ncbi:uncharacterized protein KIAA0825 homolog isoform X1 [Biomphalaria glabrata]|uniref:Uncharacterized protein KIAA0825 homolog isoform X1 n=1 Tax=Biomphalaria glabrata TaxID=6526 RepID=A0A9W3AFH0_BIOGL|nr:uncharacterized protein KIAA0825 homolog isoform X1 [Biomphalaria glabrata]
MSQYTQENGPTDYFPPIAALFHEGIVPSSVSLHSLLADIDSQLDSNTRQLDICLQSILTSANNLPSSQTFSTPKDALGYMCNSHTLEKDTCYDPVADEAVAIIVALCDSLEKNPGSEESILQEMLGLASEEGLLLPFRCSPNSIISQSSSSLNVQLDMGDQLIENKWFKLTKSIQKHIITELLQIPPLGQNLRSSWAVIERRLELVGGLRTLASDEDAWVTYRNVRSQQLEILFRSLLPDNDSENVNYKEFCCNCMTVADKIIEMIEEDFSVLCTGVFKKIGGMYRILHDLYLEKYSDEMSVLVEEIADDIRDFNKKVVKSSKSDHGLAKIDAAGSKSPQPKTGQRGSLGAVPLNEPWASKTPSFSQSLDTMFLASSYKPDKDKSAGPKLQKQGSMTFPKDCMTALKHIAMSLMKLEDFLDTLTKMTSWEVTGLPTAKKVKKKSSLRGVLKPSSSPELKRHSLNLGSSFSSTDTANESSSPVLHLPPTDNPPPPKVVERNRSEDKCRWDWRLIFKKIAPSLATAIETKLDLTMSSSLAHETSQWVTEHCLEMAEVDFVQLKDGTDHPRIVSKGTQDFIQAVNELLPLARGGIEGCLIPVKMAFIDSIGIAVKNFNLHCVSLSKDLPHKGQLKQLLIIMSNAVHIKNYLNYLENVLSAEDNGKKFMSSLLKQYTDLVDGLGKHLLQLHHQFISIAVLADAESGNWSEIKDFYEDERCSFTIQMWNYHLRGLQHDMWAILPPRLAQSLFGSILQDSLLLLTQRYSRVKPSRRRTKQFRYDITAILLCVADHLLKSSYSLSQYLDAGHNQHPHYSIHNLCSNLLAVLAVVASPIETLYRVFKRGFHRKLESQGSGDNSEGGHNTQWLHWVWPALIHSGTKHYDDMQTASALYLHLSLFLNQPQTDWALLIQALLMKEQNLCVLLLTRSCMLEGTQTSQLANTLRTKAPLATSISTEISPAPAILIDLHSSQSSTDSSSPLDSSPMSLSLDLTSVTIDSENPSDVQQVSDALVHVITHINYFPNALAKCVVATIDRCAIWEMFNIKNPQVTPRMTIPEWLISVFQILDPFIDRTIEPMLRYVNRVKTSEKYIRPVISYVADLPCGCPPNYSLRDHPKPPDTREVLTHCVQLVITEIEKCVVVLPAAVCCLFNAIDQNCKEQGIKTSYNCVAFHIIAWALWIRLGHLAAGLDKMGSVISSDARSYMYTLSDTLFHVLVYGKGPLTPHFAARFIKVHKDWLQMKIQSIRSYIADEFHSHTSTDISDSTTIIFQDHMFSVMAATIMDTPKGFQKLKTLCNLVRNNGPWLLEQMDISPPLVTATDSRQKKNSFKLDLTEHQKTSAFDPVKEMDSLGSSSFNQKAIMEFTFDWVALLTSDLGLSQFAFRNLLMNRYEMQEGAHLEEDEKKPVDVLRAVYEHRQDNFSTLNPPLNSVSRIL